MRSSAKKQQPRDQVSIAAGCAFVAPNSTSGEVKFSGPVMSSVAALSTSGASPALARWNPVSSQRPSAFWNTVPGLMPATRSSGRPASRVDALKSAMARAIWDIAWQSERNPSGRMHSAAHHSSRSRLAHSTTGAGAETGPAASTTSNRRGAGGRAVRSVSKEKTRRASWWFSRSTPLRERSTTTAQRPPAGRATPSAGSPCALAGMTVEASPSWAGSSVARAYRRPERPTHSWFSELATDHHPR